MEKRKKIAIISQPNLPIPDVRGGGIELLTRLIIEQNEIDKRYRLIVFSIYDEEGERISNQYKYCEVIYIKVNKLLYLYGRALNLLAGIFRQERIGNRSYYSCVFEKIKHINGLSAVIFEGGPAAAIGMFREYTDKLVFHSHVREFPRHRWYFYDKIITVSDFCKHDWLKNYSEEKIEILRNCIDTKKFLQKINDTEKLKLRRNLGMLGNDFVVVYVGRIIPLKGVMELVGAWKFITNHHIKLLIIGSLYGSYGTEKKYSMMVEKAAKEDKRIILTGYVDNGKLYKYLQIADVQVVPTIGDEAAGLVAVEGMASGLPLICTDSGGLPEYCSRRTSTIIKRSENISNDIANAIINYYKTPAIKKLAEQGASDILDEYSSKKYYDNYFKALGV